MFRPTQQAAEIVERVEKLSSEDKARSSVVRDALSNPPLRKPAGSVRVSRTDFTRGGKGFPTTHNPNDLRKTQDFQLQGTAIATGVIVYHHALKRKVLRSTDGFAVQNYLTSKNPKAYTIRAAQNLLKLLGHGVGEAALPQDSVLHLELSQQTISGQGEGEHALTVQGLITQASNDADYMAQVHMRVAVLMNVHDQRNLARDLIQGMMDSKTFNTRKGESPVCQEKHSRALLSALNQLGLAPGGSVVRHMRVPLVHFPTSPSVFFFWGWPMARLAREQARFLQCKRLLGCLQKISRVPQRQRYSEIVRPLVVAFLQHDLKRA